MNFTNVLRPEYVLPPQHELFLGRAMHAPVIVNLKCCLKSVVCCMSVVVVSCCVC
jgi:hypothetical protein